MPLVSRSSFCAEWSQHRHHRREYHCADRDGAADDTGTNWCNEQHRHDHKHHCTKLNAGK